MILNCCLMLTHKSHTDKYDSQVFYLCDIIISMHKSSAMSAIQMTLQSTLHQWACECLRQSHSIVLNLATVYRVNDQGTRGVTNISRVRVHRMNAGILLENCFPLLDAIKDWGYSGNCLIYHCKTVEKVKLPVLPVFLLRPRSSQISPHRHCM